MSRAGACPTCKAGVERASSRQFPFCSERCQQVDLGRWFSEEYRVPDEPADPEAVARALIAEGGGMQGDSGDSGDSH